MYIFRTDLNKPKIMLHIHKKIGAYAQFGGHIELNENPWQAVEHEMTEETGYALEQVQILQPTGRRAHVTSAVVHPYPIVYSTMGYPNNKTHFHTDSAYAFVTNQAPLSPPQDGESTELQLFTREEVATLSDIDEITRDTALYIFDNCLDNWQPVPTKSFE
jgi:8-oxo-dGTP pyrophosphatase MutT (NUDIX family)